MCKKRETSKKCVDNFLLVLIVVIFMLLYLYFNTQNPGIIAIIVVITIFALVVFSIRLEECGTPEWIVECIKKCNNSDQEEEET
jgi:hypothetical protein